MVFQRVLSLLKICHKQPKTDYLGNVLARAFDVTAVPSIEASNGLPNLVAHDCGYPLSRYTCRATRVGAS